MSERYQEAMTKAVQETMADVCFLDAQPSAQQNISGVSHILSIRIHSPFPAILELSLPLELKKQIVENIRGEEWSKMNPQEIDDSLLELINIVAGRFLHFYTEEKKSYQLGLPELTFEPAKLGDEQKRLRYYFDIEGGWMCAALIVAGG